MLERLFRLFERKLLRKKHIQQDVPSYICASVDRVQRCNTKEINFMVNAQYALCYQWYSGQCCHYIGQIVTFFTDPLFQGVWSLSVPEMETGTMVVQNFT